MPSGFLRTASTVRGGVISDGEEAGEAPGLLERTALEGPLQPAHLEGGVRGAHHAGHLDRNGLAPDLGEGIVLAGVLVQGHRGAVGDEVVGLEPALAHDHRIDRERAHVLDEAGEVEGDLCVARPVGLGRWSDGARTAPGVDLDHVGDGGAGAAEPQQDGRQDQRQRQAAERHQPPVVGLHARRADALVPDLGRLLVGRHRRGRLAVAQGGAFEGHGRGPLALVLEVGSGREGGTVALAHALRRDQAGLSHALPAGQALRPRWRRTGGTAATGGRAGWSGIGA